MGLSFDILIFDCLLKAPQPITGLFLIISYSIVHILFFVKCYILYLCLVHIFLLQAIYLSLCMSIYNFVDFAWEKCSVFTNEW